MKTNELQEVCAHYTKICTGRIN